ncbi:Repeat domain-containing protein [Paenibacillus sp. UNCCL117]|uniref:FG-GAP repeat domain-containing protein n=1 Tax=unclassified Paenibacillus TaxID=185978 RepID=UPI000880C03A|nr:MULTISPECIES: VCBS repeat-containing protein [unclassified Paenibacillus]SDE51270.1 Repeat domain-containing protein [Paenibacillus sp. cl123]SFW67182.1 Repeat domain-containing protein [Paenibacillus sp. UNCCL117]
MIRTPFRKVVVTALGLLPLAVLLFVLFPFEKQLEVRMLYATQGADSDQAAYGQLRQSLLAGLSLDKRELGNLNARQLKHYDTIYLDPALHGTMTDAQRRMLNEYVRQGGHLFLENAFATDFDPAFLGAAEVLDVPVPAASRLPTPPGTTLWEYPGVDADVLGVQQVLKTFADTFFRHDTQASLSRFSWGKGIRPSTAQPLVTMDGLTLYSVNQIGSGTVFLSGTLLPSRYYVTGYDLQSGMDPALGFERLAAEDNAAVKPSVGALYFDRNQLKIEPYFHFTFASGNALLRTEYAAYVSRLKLGFSVKKSLGPYGRPAMAHQNHFEAMEAIRDGEGIQWTELLQRYQQVPSFSLVRSAFTWGRWQESVVVHLNTGTNEKPAFAGEMPNSFYSSGTRLLADGRPIRLAPYPEYRSLGDKISEPVRAVPAVADLDGDGRLDLVVGSSDGALYAYPGVQAADGAYDGQQLPEGLAAPLAFGQPQALRTAAGAPLTAGGSYASVAAYDLNGDGRPDLVIGRSDGTLAAAYGEAGGVFTAPVPLLGGGQPIRAAAPVAAAVADVTGDGIPDLVVGDGGGAVTLHAGERGPGGALAFGRGELLARLPSAYAAPSVRDMDGDGRADLVVGGLEGDLRVYLQQTDNGGRVVWRDAGVIEGAGTNQLGSKALVGGHNAVPLWIDLNGDGRDDLVVGQLEFSSPWPIDDPAFPYKEQLQAFIRHTTDRGLELYPHLYFHQYMSDAQEKREIALHRAAFDKLGIPWKHPGTNQHTWRINNPERLQTLGNERDAGIWFNFGFKPSFIKADPRLGVEYNWGLPFLMTDASGEPDLQKPMMLYTPAPVLRTDPQYSTKDLFEAYAANDLPIDYFEHIEYHFPLREQELLEFVTYLDGLRDTYSYNFMTETQMARSFLNAQTTRVKLTRPWTDAAVLRLKRLLGLQADPRFRATPDVSGVPEQAAEYQGTLGLIVEPGSAYTGRLPATASAVRDLRGGKLYFGAARQEEVRFVKPSSGAATGSSAGLGIGGASAASPAPAPAPLPDLTADGGIRMLRVNVPYALQPAEDRWQLSLQAAGMQQVVLLSRLPLQIEGPDLTIERDEAAGSYTVTHFGNPVELKITWDPS